MTANPQRDMWHGERHYVRRYGKLYRVCEADSVPAEPKPTPKK